MTGSLLVPPGCGSVDRGVVEACLGRLGYRTVASFQPPSHYWPFQWIESGIFLALAVGLLALGIVRTLRRDA